MSFEALGLRAELLAAVASKGYSTPTPVQTQAIPVIFEGVDLLASAQTGTGKTAAFGLPIVQMLAQNPSAKKRRSPRALVLVPTRELAAQVSEQMQNYGRRLGLRSTMIYGGVNIQAQIERLHRGVDVVVATPGRLLDHARRGTIDLTQIAFLVLDEADRMLDLGFIDDILEVARYLPEVRQTLLFSATFSASIRQLADELLDSPRRIEVARRNLAADAVAQAVYPVEKSRKREMLSHLIRKGDWTQVLVFTRTRFGADQLTAELLFDGIAASAIHSNKSQSVRTRTLAEFKRGELRVLVATDVAARGLDIQGLPHVVNYELPQVPEDYVHRIGRTGRAGQNGIALSLVCPAEAQLLEDIEKLLGLRIPRKQVEDFPLIAVKRGAAPRARKSTRSAPRPGKKSDASVGSEMASDAPARPGRKPPKAAAAPAVKPAKGKKPVSVKSRTVGRKKAAPAPAPPRTGGRGRRG